MEARCGETEMLRGDRPPWLALQWIDGDPLPRCLVNAALELVWANPPARSHFLKGRDIECYDGVITPSDPTRLAAFSDFVLGCGRELSTFCLPRDNDDGFLLFRAREVSRHGGQRFFGIAFHPSEPSAKWHYADLNIAFQLTPSEIKVVEKLAEGHTTDEIASGMRISIATVRSHLKHVYAKLEVTSREGLFSRIQPFRI